MTPAPEALPELTDGVVLLRPFAVTDAPALAQIGRDPGIRSRNTVPEPTEASAVAWVGDLATRTGSWEWAVVDVASGALAGRRALKHVSWESGRASAACWIAPEHRGRQLAPRSLRLAAAWAFSQGLARVQAECEADNAASLASVRAAGMHHEGTLRSYFVSNTGVRTDAELYSLLPGDLAQAPPFRTVSAT